MDKKAENELFEHLVRIPKVVDWFQGQLDEQIKVLLVNPNTEQLHKAQGAAAAYKTVLDRLAAARAALTR